MSEVTLARPFGRFARPLEAGAVACLFVLMLVVLIDVAGRNLLNRPLPWGTELLEVVLAAMIFLLYPVLALGSEHITVDLITVRPSLQRMQRMLASTIGAVVFVVIAWCVGKQGIRSAGYGEASAMLHIPTAWVLFGMAALAIVTALAFLVATARATRGPLPPHALVE